MESTVSNSDPHTSAGIQIANYDMENKSTPYPNHRFLILWPIEASLVGF
jgi:hypothetical protein